MGCCEGFRRPSENDQDTCVESGRRPREGPGTRMCGAPDQPIGHVAWSRHALLQNVGLEVAHFPLDWNRLEE